MHKCSFCIIKSQVNETFESAVVILIQDKILQDKMPVI